MSEKAILTCALTGVLTNPKQHPVPVTPKEMAASGRDAYNAGASILHVHIRNQEPGLGHLPSWDPAVAKVVVDAIRAACPGVIINLTTGVVGEDVSGPIACLESVRPEMAACNAGTLNYLRVRAKGDWAWPPMIFDNPVHKVQTMVETMKKIGVRPEFECFDVGIVRCVGLYTDVGMVDIPNYNFVMGVESGMPSDPKLLELLLSYRKPDTDWQVTAIGRGEVWKLHERAAELGGNLRTGVEDTFYLPNNEKCTGNGQLIEELAATARRAGREIASPAEARNMLHLA